MCQKEHCAKCASLLSYAQIAGDPKLHLLLTLRRREIERERLKAQLPAGATAPPQPQQPQQPEEFLACTKCAIVVTRQEKARMYREVFTWGRRDNRLRIIYEEGVVWSRREMEKLFPRYARLVDSISREGSGKVFDPFSNPKTVGFSVDHSANDIDADFIHNYEVRSPSLSLTINLTCVRVVPGLPDCLDQPTGSADRSSQFGKGHQAVRARGEGDLPATTTHRSGEVRHFP